MNTPRRRPTIEELEARLEAGENLEIKPNGEVVAVEPLSETPAVPPKPLPTEPIDPKLLVGWHLSEVWRRGIRIVNAPPRYWDGRYIASGVCKVYAGDGDMFVKRFDGGMGEALEWVNQTYFPPAAPTAKSDEPQGEEEEKT